MALIGFDRNRLIHPILIKFDCWALNDGYSIRTLIVGPFPSVQHAFNAHHDPPSSKPLHPENNRNHSPSEIHFQATNSHLFSFTVLSAGMQFTFFIFHPTPAAIHSCWMVIHAERNVAVSALVVGCTRAHPPVDQKHVRKINNFDFPRFWSKCRLSSSSQSPNGVEWGK